MKLVYTVIISILMAGCISNQLILKVNSKEDIPKIDEQYASRLIEMEVGMGADKVFSLFPLSEKECYPSGVCNITIFREDLIQVDKRIGDLNLLTGSLISLLALTCIVSDEDCNEAIVAAINVGLASAIDHNRIQTSKVHSNVVTLIQWINIEVVDNKVTQWAINEPLEQFKPKSYKNELPSLEESLGTTNNAN